MNIKEIARIAQVSKSTVSRVLNNDPYVSEETRKRVLDVVERTGYFPNFVARSLKIKRTRTVGVVVPDIGNPFYFEILRGIEKVLDKHGFNMMLCNSEYSQEKELRYLTLLASKKVDGIIAAPCSESSRGIKALVKWEIPFVLVDVLQRDYKTNIVYVDHAKVSYIATSYLIKNGHTEIALIDALRESEVRSDFILGYERALAEANLPLRPQYVQKATPDIAGGRRAIKNLMAEGIKFSAVVAICDLVAVGVYRAARELQLRVPEDISVIGNDDIPLAKYLDPPLTTIQQPKYKLGIKSAEMLLDYIENNSYDVNNAKVLELGTRLVIRDSVLRKGAKDVSGVRAKDLA